MFFKNYLNNFLILHLICLLQSVKPTECNNTEDIFQKLLPTLPNLDNLNFGKLRNALIFGENNFNVLPTNEITTNINCTKQLHALFVGLQNKEAWTLAFFDSWAKLPAGIIYGHLTELGHYDECLNYKQEITNDNVLRGKYCLAKVPLVPKLEKQALPISLKLGICIPQVCSAEQMEKTLQLWLKLFANKLGVQLPINDIKLNESNCSEKGATRKFEIIDWIAIIFCIVLALLLFISTAFDYAKEKEISLPILMSAFSLRHNLQQLFHTNSQTLKKSPNIIGCLNGMRCISLMWVIMGHTYMLKVASPTINPTAAKDWLRTPYAMFFVNGTFSVDVFFFMSGLLLAVVALRQMDKSNGRLNVPLMYLHRYLRLTPVLLVAILFVVSFYRDLGEGPLWKQYENYFTCSKSWWRTLLYVQNYIGDKDDVCLGHSWYLAADMQLYIISPLILFAIWHWQKRGVAILVILGLLHVGCVFTIFMVKQYSIFGFGINSTSAMFEIYFSPHTRASPWLVGIIFGYFLHKRQGKRVVLTKSQLCLGWLTAICLLLGVLFFNHPRLHQGYTDIPVLRSALFASLGRVAWPLGWAWIVFACYNGYGGPLNVFLCWSFWQPLSKLSYCMYVWHMFIVVINVGRLQTNTYLSDYDGMLTFCGNYFMTLLVSMLIYLTVEAPMTSLEKVFLRKSSTSEISIKQTTYL